MRRPLVWVALALIPQMASAQSDVPPRRKGASLAWLKAETYRASYAAEPAMHVSSSGAHGMNVRTYYDPVLADDFARGPDGLPQGRRDGEGLYLGGTEQTIGWAVMSKVRRRSGRAGRGWLFYETMIGARRRTCKPAR